MPDSGGDRDVCVWAPLRVIGGGTISCGVLALSPGPVSDPDRKECVAGKCGKFIDGVAVDPSADGAGCGDPRNSRGRSCRELVELLRWGLPSWLGSLSVSLTAGSGLNGFAVASSEEVESSVSSSRDNDGILG